MITPSAGMEPAGACHAKKCAPVFAVRRWKSNGVWMARTGYVSAAATCACAIAQHPCDRPQVLPAYGLQDLRNEQRDPKTKSNPNTMCLLITPGGNRGTGHFYLAKNRTFLLCVDMNLPGNLRAECAPARRSNAPAGKSQISPRRCLRARWRDFFGCNWRGE